MFLLGIKSYDLVRRKVKARRELTSFTLHFPFKKLRKIFQSSFSGDSSKTVIPKTFGVPYKLFFLQSFHDAFCLEIPFDVLLYGLPIFFTFSLFMFSASKILYKCQNLILFIFFLICYEKNILFLRQIALEILF